MDDSRRGRTGAGERISLPRRSTSDRPRRPSGPTGRLLSGLPRLCPSRRRADSSRRSKMRAPGPRSKRRRRHRPRFTAEGLESSSPNGIDRSAGAPLRRGAGDACCGSGAIRARSALACWWAPTAIGRRPSCVAATCEALQWAGCRARRSRRRHFGIAGGRGRRRAGRRGAVDRQQRRASRTRSSLQALGPRRPALVVARRHSTRCARSMNRSADRPKRRGGGLERADATRGLSCAARPSCFTRCGRLRFVLDTRCDPLVRYFERLNVTSACELLRPRALELRRRQRSTARASLVSSSGALDDRGPRRASRAVPHFGLWIDGDGEACRLVDERGAAVDGERLLLTAGRLHLPRSDRARRSCVEREASAASGAVAGAARRTRRARRDHAASDERCDATPAAPSSAAAPAADSGLPASRPRADALLTLEPAVWRLLEPVGSTAVGSARRRAERRVYKRVRTRSSPALAARSIPASSRFRVAYDA